MRDICICGYNEEGHLKREGGLHDRASIKPDKLHSRERHRGGETGLKCLDCSCPVYVRKRGGLNQ